MKMNGIAAPLEHGAAKIVVQQDSGKTLPVFKGMNVAAQKALHALVEEELEVQRPGIGERDDKAGKLPASPANGNFSKMRPVHLSLFAGKVRRRRNASLWVGRMQATTRRSCTTLPLIAAIPDHLENPGGPQMWMLCQNLPNEVRHRDPSHWAAASWCY